jgi:hypothetical protein
MWQLSLAKVRYFEKQTIWNIKKMRLLFHSYCIPLECLLKQSIETSVFVIILFEEETPCFQEEQQLRGR